MTADGNRAPLPTEIKPTESEVSTRAQPSLVHSPPFEQLKQCNATRDMTLVMARDAACLRYRLASRCSNNPTSGSYCDD